MAGYQTIEALRPILHRGPVPVAMVNRELVRPLTEREKLIVCIREMRAKKISQYVIAEQLGVSRAFVQRSTKGMKPPEGGWMKRGRVSKYNREKAQRMSRAGFTYAEIAEDLGCCQSNAHRLVTGRGWKGGCRNRPTRKYEEMVARATGMTSTDLRANAPAEGRTVRSAKARSILYWLIRQREPTLPLAEIGRHLGGFHSETIRHGAHRCAEVADALGVVLTHPRSGGFACRLLWETDWRGVVK